MFSYLGMQAWGRVGTDFGKGEEALILEKGDAETRDIGEEADRASPYWIKLPGRLAHQVLKILRV
jgi:hypothetical protein